MGLKLSLLLLFFVLIITGCSGGSVRNLASEITLIKVGTTTQKEVLAHLQEPNERRDLGGGRVQWLYRDQKKTLLEKSPLVGTYMDSLQYHLVVVTFTNNTVTDLAYSLFDKDDLDWLQDYSWQDEKN